LRRKIDSSDSLFSRHVSERVVPRSDASVEDDAFFAPHAATQALS